MIKRLKNQQIDKKRWDEVISNSDNPSVYHLSWYLDIVSPGWEAYVYNDYSIVMPLPVKQKWGIPYLMQPIYCQKLGITGNRVESTIASIFYKKAFRHFPHINIQVYDSQGLKKGEYLNVRTNYTLDLRKEFSVLQNDFTENTIRNIKKARKANLKLQDCNTNDFMIFCDKWLPGVNKKQLRILNDLIEEAFKRDIVKLFKVIDQKGEIISAACFLVWNYQILYLAGLSSEEGKKNSAMFLIMENIIMQYAASGFLLDFEGSNIPGVANFFRGFGGKASYYYHLKKNCLSSWI